jgi:hypothetical protein
VINYYFNKLDDSHPKNGNIPGLRINLMNHQKTSIYHAKKLESNEGFSIEYKKPEYCSDINMEDDYDFRNFYSTFGIIACKVGSGKSFVALALIIDKPLINFNRYSISDRSQLCYSFKKVNSEPNTVSTNIILVPHNLFKQWKGYITDYTNLDAIYVSVKKDIQSLEKLFSKTDISEEEKRENINTLTENKVYLISSKQWNNFADFWRLKIEKKASRIFVDEVHSINVPSCSRIKSNFLWFITSSIRDLGEHRNHGFIRDNIERYQYLSSVYQKYLVIKNNDNYVDSSLKLDAPVETTIKCIASRILNIFKEVINQDVKDMLLAEDVQGVVNYLGIKTINESEIIKVLCSNLEKELDNAKINLNMKSQMHYSNDAAKNAAIKKAQDKIDAINSKINGVKQRITEAEIDPIMHTEIINPVITDCCKNKFDLDSISFYYEFNQKKVRDVTCPMCRKPLDMSKLIYLGEKKEEEVIEKTSDEWNSEKHTKIENLEHLLKKIDKNKKILIFSEHEGNFETISDAFKSAERNNLQPVKGSISHISSLIDNYNSGEIPNLFLNAKYCGSGLNLQKTEIIIIMHKMTPDAIKQVIGRAQRIGRTSQLQVYFLYAENE